MNSIIEFITSGNLIFMIVFIVISGAIAYWGDIIGYRLGKKRLTIGKLRPRTTAKVITVITGVVIATTTLVIAAIASQEVRLFLFHMEEIRENLITLEQEKNDLQELIESYKKDIGELKNNNEKLTVENERIAQTNTDLEKKNQAFISENHRLIKENEKQIALNEQLINKNVDLSQNNELLARENEKLQKDNSALSQETDRLFTKVNELKNIIEIKKKNSLAFTANQIVDYVILGRNIGEENITQKFRDLVERVIQICKNAGAKPRNFTDIWNESEPARNRLAEFIKNIYLKQPKSNRKELLVKVISPENVFKGEKINNFQFWFEQNIIHIPKGYSSTYFIDGTKSRYEIALSLEMFFDYMKDFLKLRGVVSELSIPTIKIYDLVNQFHDAKQKIKFYITFTDNVYTIGDIQYEFKYEIFVEPNDLKSEKTALSENKTLDTSEVSIEPETTDIYSDSQEATL